MKKILIIGAESYIGINVEARLKQETDKYHVDTLDVRTDEWREFDFSIYDVVYHVAGIAHADVGDVSEETKKLYYKVNSDLAIEVAQKAKHSGVTQFIFMSSMIVYGGAEYITQNTEPCPANFYGDSKWKADCGIRTLGDDKFRVVVLRPPMIYGKNSKGNYPILSQMAQKLPVFPKIDNKRSMLYIGNLCEFVKMMIDNEEAGVFFPQNSQLVNTSVLVAEIAKAHNHSICVSKLFLPIVWIAKKIPGKISGMCNKAFGNSYYDLEMSTYKEPYAIFGFEQTIHETEV